ncbi:MAG: serine/threonine protein kinase [Ottowia sp.]|jgi:serine/threonine protein kinase|uniref:Serine/threonine protein kinase n=1 Tax=Ottowia beijingensis TaxID=1207057 RepID=A0A853IWI3_9BURK|nr:serine/threonine-protein kinase [Ottowia beijingensis]MBP6779611.1 serine/threonine protein kinase [Ottowia sp.]MBP7536699.1 serine/threonine protein kinase [Ottowia sp.]NZA02824.1 serine/threonine protein kinase [Ottowia beijingensis]
MSKQKPAPLPADTVIGGYRVVRRISAGGFGVVYLAVDKEGQQVAIKEYLPSALTVRDQGELVPHVAPEKLSLYRLGLKSFFEEGRSLAQISHPSVVSVLNFFRQNETVYMVMNYLEGATLQDFIVTARDLKKQKVFRESTIRSLFDEILRGLRIVHQHKMLHLDLKPANIFITDDNKAVMIDFGAAREVLNKEGNFTRPMYTPGFAAPEMYRRDSTMGPWTDIYAIGACIYSCMQGYPPNDAPQRLEKDRLALSLTRMRGVYSDNLIEVVEWCMSLDPLSRPQSVFALQKELSREGERQYTKLSVGEKVRLQFDNMVTDTKKNLKRATRFGKS